MHTRRSVEVPRLTATGEPLEMVEEMTAAGPRRRFSRALPTLPALCDYARDTFGPHPFLRYDNESHSFAAVDAAAMALAEGLRRVGGVGRGDRVAIAMRNAPAWIVLYRTAAGCGAGRIERLVDRTGTRRCAR